MGAGSAKGANINDDETDNDADRFSVISQDSSEAEAKEALPSPKANKGKSKIRAKIEALTEGLDDELPPPFPVSENEKKEEERKRGLFGFARKKDEEDKTNVFVHEVDENNKKKKENANRFKFFAFRKDGKKSEEKDEKLEQEINDLQRTFDSLGIAGHKAWDEKKPQRPNSDPSKKSQSADDIRDLEPMRNRMNQKRRFSRPANAGTTIFTGGIGPSIKRGGEGSSNSGGSRRTFKYSWEMENINSSPVRSEEWNYEAVIVDGFDINKFKMANFEGSYITDGLSSRMPNSVTSSSPISSASGTKTPLIYDPAEQKILATIERDFV